MNFLDEASLSRTSHYKLIKFWENVAKYAQKQLREARKKQRYILYRDVEICSCLSGGRRQYLRKDEYGGWDIVYSKSLASTYLTQYQAEVAGNKTWTDWKIEII